MAQVEDDIVATGVQIVWVLEADREQTPGTAESCATTMELLGSEDQGWCVGDGQTDPLAGAFDESEFSRNRGFDILVARSTMEIVWASNHGSSSGNENLDGEAVLQAARDAVDLL